MTEFVTRYVVTHVDKDGRRTLCGPAQGRCTKEAPEEAQQLLDSMMQNNRVEGGRLAGVYGLPLEVRPVKCYPHHFDPINIWFDSEAAGPEQAADAPEVESDRRGDYPSP